MLWYLKRVDLGCVLILVGWHAPESGARAVRLVHNIKLILNLIC